MMALNQAETFEWLRQRVEILESENVRLTQELQAAEERRITILEWLENEIGTGWNCDCGRTEYNTLPFCQQCAKDAPLLHLLAFKLHVARNDSSEAQKQAV